MNNFTNKELISVIIPIYNVEKYLQKCIDSIINQTYKNLEIILIDDGSTDDCASMCDKYKIKDSRIIVIHKANGGLSDARNIGISIAKGNLICFIDSDDYLEYNMIEKLKENMDKYNSDISACNFYDINDNKKKIRINEEINTEFSLSGKEKFINMQSKYSPLTYYAWNKLYKKELFDKIKFPKGRLYEYSYIMCEIFDKAKKMSFTLEPLYNYVYRSNSLGNIFNIKHFDKIGSFDRKIEFFENKKYHDLAIEEKNRKACDIIRNLAKMRVNKIQKDDIYNKYYEELIRTVKEISWNESNKKIKLFKLLKKTYITLIYLIYKIKNRRF